MNIKQKELLSEKLEDAIDAIMDDDPSEASFILNDVYESLREPYNRRIINDLPFLHQAE